MELSKIRSSEFDGHEGRSSASSPSEGLFEEDQPPCRRSRSLFGQLWRYAGLEGRQCWQRVDYSYEHDSDQDAPILGAAWSPSRGHLPRERRRLRRRKVVSFVKRGICAVPLLFLMFLYAKTFKTSPFPSN